MEKVTGFEDDRDVVVLNKLLERIDKKTHPQGVAVADADAGTIVAQFNALLASLRTAGVIIT